jgi:preprotein translocase subunit SecD
MMRNLPFLFLLSVACSSTVTATTSLPSTPTLSAPATGSGSVHLQLRPVLVAVDPATLRWKRLDAICEEAGCPDLRIEPSEAVVAQNAEGVRDRLGPAIATDENVVAARVTQAGDPDGWFIDVQLDASGTTAMAAATRTAVAQPAPRNMIAILVDGVVVSAPIVNVPIDAGGLLIPGNFSKTDAQALVDEITS